MPAPLSAAAMNGPPPGATGTSPLWTPNRPASNRMMLLNSGMLHIIGVPLLILGSLAVGFMLVYLKEVLVPFVISVFIVYLLRPLVNLLTTPFSRALGVCCPVHGVSNPIVTNIRHRIARSTGYSRVSGVPDTPDNESGGQAASQAPANRRRGASPPKYHKSVRSVINKTMSSGVGCLNAVASSAPASGAVPSSASSAVRSPPLPSPLLDEDCGCCCGPFRITRCPRWFAILVALMIAASVLAGIVILVADAVQRFKEDSLQLYVSQAGKLADELQDWLAMFGIHIEASAVLDAIKEQISVVNVVQTTLTVIVEGVGNMILILLLVLYLLAEQNQHAPGSLRAKVDNQIQRYVVIKTAISAAQGAVVFFILGYILDVRMAHLFGVLHFIMNYIPTAGPIIATVVPLPVVILDPSLGLTAKIAAFAAPTVVHMVVGNFMEPLVFGSSMELHPVSVIMALALFYAIWGVAGAILAVPITAVIRIILSSVDHPYAHIVINVLEGRLSAASQQFDSALDGALEVDLDVENGAMQNYLLSARSRPAPSTDASSLLDERPEGTGLASPDASALESTPMRSTSASQPPSHATRRQIFSHGSEFEMSGVSVVSSVASSKTNTPPDTSGPSMVPKPPVATH